MKVHLEKIIQYFCAEQEVVAPRITILLVFYKKLMAYVFKCLGEIRERLHYMLKWVLLLLVVPTFCWQLSLMSSYTSC